MLTRLCFAALSALLLHACSEGTCGPTRVENLETGRCDCRSEYVEVDMICILRTEFDGGPDVGIDAPEFDGGPDTDGCTETTLYRDRDRDGRGDPDDSIVACSDPQYVDNADDCDDSCNVCWTGAEEVCDTVDNDCDGFSDEGLTVPVGDPVMITTGEGALAQLTTSQVFAEQLTDGSYILFYERSDRRFVTRIFDPRTEEVGVESVVDEASPRLSLSPMVRQIGGLIAIVGHASDGSSAAIRGRTYDLSGNPTGPAFEVIEVDTWETSTSTYHAPLVELVPSGTGYFLAWRDENGETFATPVQNNLSRPFAIEPRLIWSDADGDLRWISAVGNADGLISAFRETGSGDGIAQLDLGSPGSDWAVVTATQGVFDARVFDDEVRYAIAELVAPDTLEESSRLVYETFDLDGTRTDQSIVFDEPALMFPPRFQESLPLIGSYRVSPTDRVAAFFRPDGTMVTVSTTANPAAPTMLGAHGAVYLESGSDVAPSDVAFRRFGCPD